MLGMMCLLLGRTLGVLNHRAGVVDLVLVISAGETGVGGGGKIE